MKGYYKKIITGFAATTMLCMMIGCGSVAPDTDGGADKDDESIEIGMCFDSFVIERWEKDRDVFCDTASSLGATVNVQNANGNVDKQIEQIEYLVDKGVDCLVIIPVDGDAISDAVSAAIEKGIAVVSYDRLIPNVNTDLYISFDNNEVGIMLGEAIADAGAENVIMICGPLTDNNVPMVNEGFLSVMEENDIEILDSYNCEGWRAELGGAYVYDHMSLIKNADAIMCGNDDVASSVIRALAVSQLAGVIPVVGQDADLPACQHIVEGTQLMTVYKPVGKLAEQAADLAVKLAKGESISVSSKINDGTYNVPYVAVEPIAVTADNMDEIIIDSGFHTKEDVYLNRADTE